MRGYLALSVMVQHAAVARQWLATGTWTLPADPLFSQLGSVAVSLFFMVTGFLFWGKLVKSGGKLIWSQLYIGRVFRIAPVYFLAVSLMLAVVMLRTGFVLHESMRAFAVGVVHWFGLGLLIGHDLNGYENTWIILAGVVWTLKYEWRFYFALLPASIFARRRSHLPTATALLVASLYLSEVGQQGNNWSYVSLFAAGMVAASIRKVWPTETINDRAGSLAAALLLVFLIWLHPAPFSSIQAGILFVFFVLISQGATLFGAFSSTAAVRLGHTSFAIYLLQGLIFSIVWDTDAGRSFITRTETNFWFATVGSAVMLSVVSAVVFVKLERPGIAMGRSAGRKFSRRAERVFGAFNASR